MKKLIPTTLAVFTALAALLFVVPTRSHALESIAFVDKGLARELGLQIRSEHAAEDTMRVVLEMPIKGQLTDFKRVEFRVHDGKKLLLNTFLKEEEFKPGHVRVSFDADPQTLKDATLKIVTYDGLDLRVGLVIKVKEFVE